MFITFNFVFELVSPTTLRKNKTKQIEINGLEKALLYFVSPVTNTVLLNTCKTDTTPPHLTRVDDKFSINFAEFTSFSLQ